MLALFIYAPLDDDRPCFCLCLFFSIRRAKQTIYENLRQGPNPPARNIIEKKFELILQKNAFKYSCDSR